MGFRVSDRNLHTDTPRHKDHKRKQYYGIKNRERAVLGDQRQLPDGRVMPHGVRQREHVAAVHFAVALVAGGEVQQGKGVTCPLRLRRQCWRADHRNDAVVENDPVRLLEEEENKGGRGGRKI